MPVQQYSAVTHVDLCMQAIQRLAGTHSVEAMVWNSPAGRFLHPQVTCLCSTCSGETNLLRAAFIQISMADDISKLLVLCLLLLAIHTELYDCMVSA